jgi:hypothetical protein
MATTAEHVPAPADTPEHTADELLDEVERRGGRVFRMGEPAAVFCLTLDESLALWLMRLGGKSFVPPGMPPQTGPNRAYKRTRHGPWEWDIYIHTIPVAGEKSIWEAARAFEHGLRIR